VPNSKIVTWTFGQLPELMSLQKGKQTLFGYPALQDMGEWCELSVWDDEVQARVVHDQGILRLARTALKDNLKHLEKNIPDAMQIGMLYVGLTGGTLEQVKADILTVSLRRACQLDDSKQQPTNAASFHAMIAHAKTRLGLIVQEVGRLVLQILTEWQNAQKKLNGIKIHANQYKDISEQMTQLTLKGFIERTAYSQLSHYPRYFKAIVMRCDKLKGGIERDSQLMRDMLPLQLNWQREYNAQRTQGEYNVDVRLMEFRWLLEELRVGLFVQELRTPMPVSVKRLYKIWEAMVG
jgi:ATP-dependent helicase HrpA